MKDTRRFGLRTWACLLGVPVEPPCLAGPGMGSGTAVQRRQEPGPPCAPGSVTPGPRASVCLRLHGLLSCAEAGECPRRGPSECRCHPGSGLCDAGGMQEGSQAPSPRLWGWSRRGQVPMGPPGGSAPRAALSRRLPGPGGFRPLPAPACLSTVCSGTSSPPLGLLGRKARGLRPRESR